MKLGMEPTRAGRIGPPNPQVQLLARKKLPHVGCQKSPKTFFPHGHNWWWTMVIIGSSPWLTEKNLVAPWPTMAQARGGLRSSAGGVWPGECEYRIRSSLPGPPRERSWYGNGIPQKKLPYKRPKSSMLGLLGCSWPCFFSVCWDLKIELEKVFQSSNFNGTRHPWMSCSPCDWRCTTLDSCGVWWRCTRNAWHCKKLFFLGGIYWYGVVIMFIVSMQKRGLFWSVVWNMNFIFPNSWDDDPIWRTHIFQWGRD